MGHEQVKHTSMTDEEIAIADELFSRIDRNGDGHLNMVETVMLFQQLAPDQSTESACNAAAEALLMADANSDKRLSKREFQQLLSKIANISGLSVAEAAGKLLSNLEQQNNPAAEAVEQATHSLQPANQTQHTITTSNSTTTAAAATIAAEEAASNQLKHQGPVALPPNRTPIHQLVKDDRMLQLFRLWDKAGIGAICFEELCLGLAKFRPIHSKEDVLHTMTEAASILALHSNNSSMQLDLEGFATFMSRFMSAAGYELDDVLEQLITLAATKCDNRKLQKILDAASLQIQQLLTPQQEQ